MYIVLSASSMYTTSRPILADEIPGLPGIQITRVILPVGEMLEMQNVVIPRGGDVLYHVISASSRCGSDAFRSAYVEGLDEVQRPMDSSVCTI